MSNPNDPVIDPREATPDAGQPTPEEAAMIAAGTEVGEDGAPLDATKAAADAEAAAKAAADAAAAEAAKKAADEAAAAAAAAAQPAVATPAAPAAIAPVLPPKPEAPKDFAAERATLKAQYEAGDLDQDEYLDRRDALTVEQGRFEGALAAWQTTAATATATQQASAQQQFNTVALAWEEENAAFIENPLRQQAMQAAIALVDEQTEFKLPPAELFARAQKIAFEAYNWGAPTTPAAAAKTPEEIAREALAGRANQGGDRGAPSLAGAPAAAPMGGGGDFAGLDGQGISDLEDTIARMNPAQLKAYLETAPGATTTGHEDQL